MIRDATVLDTVLLSAVLSAATPAAMARNETLCALDKALHDQCIAPAGEVTVRLVRTAVSAALISNLDSIPNPLPAPYNLGWYFGRAVCPEEIRNFATRLGRPHLRVWSVVQSPANTYKILIQVLGADSKKEACGFVQNAAELTSRALKMYAYRPDAVTPADVKGVKVENLAHSFIPTLLQQGDLGDFVEITLPRCA